MWKFITGIIIGAVLALGYVRFNVQLPGFLQLPGLLRGNIVSTATEAELYDLDGDLAVTTRALEIYFANRPDAAAVIDANAGHPFLTALHRDRASRLSRELSMQWTAYDAVLAQPALRETLEKRYATTDVDSLKRAMLWSALEKDVWLKRWLEKTYGAQSPGSLMQTLVDARRYSTASDSDANAPTSP